EKSAEPLMCVMAVLAVENLFAGLQLAGNPKNLEVGHGSATAEMTEKVFPSKHGGNFSNCFLFHRRSRAAAIQSVVVRVDPHGQGVCKPGDWMRRLEHLARVQRMEVRIIVLKAFGSGVENFSEMLKARAI